MAKMAMEPKLILDPEKELPFKGPYTFDKLSLIVLKNPLNIPMTFNVKTNAPKMMFSVHPCRGIIKPLEYLCISVNFLQIVPGTIYSGKKPLKIMVQAKCAPSNDVHLKTFWKESSPEKIVAYKLTCVFDPPLENYLAPLKMINDGDKVKDDKAQEKTEIRELEPPCFVRPAPREIPGSVASGSEVRAVASDKDFSRPLQVNRLVDHNKWWKRRFEEVSRENIQLKAIINFRHPLQVNRLMDDNKWWKQRFEEVSHENIQLKAIVEGGLRSKSTTSTVGAQQTQSPAELDEEKDAKKIKLTKEMSRT